MGNSYQSIKVVHGKKSNQKDTFNCSINIVSHEIQCENRLIATDIETQQRDSN